MRIFAHDEEKQITGDMAKIMAYLSPLENADEQRIPYLMASAKEHGGAWERPRSCAKNRELAMLLLELAAYLTGLIKPVDDDKQLTDCLRRAHLLYATHFAPYEKFGNPAHYCHGFLYDIVVAADGDGLQIVSAPPQYNYVFVPYDDPNRPRCDEKAGTIYIVEDSSRAYHLVGRPDGMKIIAVTLNS